MVWNLSASGLLGKQVGLEIRNLPVSLQSKQSSQTSERAEVVPVDSLYNDDWRYFAIWCDLHRNNVHNAKSVKPVNLLLHVRVPIPSDIDIDNNISRNLHSCYILPTMQ